MRYLHRTIAATAAVLLAGAAAAGTARAAEAAIPSNPANPAAPAAPAAPVAPVGTKGLYPPSAVVLTVGKGDVAATATIDRVVTLACTPHAAGTHPAPAKACVELRAVNGEFAQLTETSQRTCTRQWDPVTITADGAWQGKRVSWSATYGNLCEMQAGMTDGVVFNF